MSDFQKIGDAKLWDKRSKDRRQEEEREESWIHLCKIVKSVKKTMYCCDAVAESQKTNKTFLQVHIVHII